MGLFADTIPPVKRTNAREIFLIRIVAQPAPESSEAADLGGAYVVCLVDADDLRTAEQRAIERIRAEQWQPRKFEHWEIVCRQCYSGDSGRGEKEKRELLGRVDEAFKYGCALLFHTWPVGASDAHEEYI